MERLSVSITMPGEVLWHAEWAAPVATAMISPNQTPKPGWSSR